MNISALICVHQDTGYLPLVLEQIYDLVDEIIFVDGPYRWLTDTLDDLPFNHASRISEIMFRGQSALDLPKTRYFHGIWQSEIEKRAFGYEACTCDLVFVVDSDEIFEVDPARVERFRESKDPVGKFNVFSLARTFARSEFPVGSLDYAVEHADEPWEYYRLFKRHLISAMDHVSFLQVHDPFYPEQPGAPDRQLIHPVSLGDIYHLCVMRTGFDNLVKYLFYITLWHAEYKKPDAILRHAGWKSYSEMLREITLDDYFSIVLRGRPDSVRCPVSRVITRFSKMPAPHVENLKFSDDLSGEFGISFPNPLVVVSGFPTHFYLPENSAAGAECRIFIDDIDSVTISELDAFYGRDNRENYTRILSSPTPFSTDSITFQLPPAPEDSELFARLLVVQASPRSGKSTGRICKVELNL